MNQPITKIYVVRHAQSETNAAKELHTINIQEAYGQAGEPLTEKGRQQAKELGERLKNTDFDTVVTSDYLRSQQTAEILVNGRNIPLVSYTGIRERDYGKQWETLTREERIELETALHEMNDEEIMEHHFFQDSESPNDVVKRFKKVIKELTDVYRGKTILMVSHGNIMRMFLVAIKFVEQYTDLPTGSIKNCSYFFLETDGKEYKIIETSNIIARAT